MSDGLFWASHPSLGYAPARRISETRDLLELVCEDGTPASVPKSKAQPVHRNSMIGVPNLLELGEYSMPALLHNIRVRYKRNEFYSSIGLPILISVNPYKPLPHLYDNATRLKYLCASFDSGSVAAAPVPPSRPAEGPGVVEPALSDQKLFIDRPHLFGTAQMTFAALVRNKQAQSIVISGESGAGKTEATKILLRYFSELDRGMRSESPGSGLGPGCIETFILNSNPILESFGNAKTLRNDNSSRFGRFIQLFFDVENQRRIRCARISHYLLEKCRLVSLYEKERNFHIFYQLVFGGINHAHFKQKLQIWGLHEPRKFKAILGEERLYDLLEGMHSPQTAQSHNSGGRLFSSQGVDDTSSLLQPWQSGSMWSNSSQDWTEANEWLESWGIMFDELLESMASIGFTELDVDEIFGVVAGIMHLSRVRFTSVDIPPQATYIDGMPLTKIEDYEPLEFACRLLQLKNIPSIIPAEINDPVIATADVLLFKSIRNNQGQGYWIRTPRDPVHAAHTRDSIVKEIYSRLFDWIIKKINVRLTATPVASAGGAREAHNREVLVHGATHGLRESHSVFRQARKSSAITTIRNSTPPIGLLDIYGFEVFDGRNSFEQLCINFANEKLQQHFNQHVLALEQATYRKEAIDWSDILFTDNREIIRALEEPPHGVFVILDDTRITDQRVEQPGRSETVRASSSAGERGEFRGGGNYHHHDMMFLREIDRRGLKPVVALPDRKQFRDTIFTVKHYAGVVDYCCLGFVEKNVDKLEAQSCYFLSKASRHALVRELFPHDQAEDMAVKRNSLKATLGVEFRNQLDRLLKSLTSTTPTYIRCIKPNGLKQAGLFNSHDVLRQLEYAGLLESIRIRNSGFGVRCTFQEFLDDYLITLPHEYQLWIKTGKHNQEKAKELCTKLLTLAAGHKPDAEESRRHWQIGRTKIFMREEVQVYLEQARSAKRLESAVKIQAHVRGLRQRKRWRRLRKQIVRVQARARGAAVRIRLVRNKSARVIQRYWLHTRPTRAWYLNIKHKLRFIQTWWRFQLHKRKLAAVAYERSNGSLETVALSSELLCRKPGVDASDMRVSTGEVPPSIKESERKDPEPLREGPPGNCPAASKPKVPSSFVPASNTSAPPGAYFGYVEAPWAPQRLLRRETDESTMEAALHRKRSSASVGMGMGPGMGSGQYNYEATIHLMFSELTTKLRRTEKENKKLRQELSKLQQEGAQRSEELLRVRSEKSVLEQELAERERAAVTELETLAETNDFLQMKLRGQKGLAQGIESVLSDLSGYATDRLRYAPDCDIVRDLGGYVKGCCSRGFDFLRSAVYQMSLDHDALAYDNSPRQNRPTPPYGSETSRYLGNRLSRATGDEPVSAGRHLHRLPARRNESGFDDSSSFGFEDSARSYGLTTMQRLPYLRGTASAYRREARNPYLTLGGKSLTGAANGDQIWTPAGSAFGTSSATNNGMPGIHEPPYNSRLR